MSYCPWNEEDSVESVHSAREGQYVKDHTMEMRDSHQKEIRNLVQLTFEERSQINLDEYEQIVRHKSSEMLYAVMALFHKELPFSETIFGLKGMYKEINSSHISSDNIASPKGFCASPRIMNFIKRNSGPS
jgi:hypothetical protein